MTFHISNAASEAHWFEVYTRQALPIDEYRSFEQQLNILTI